MKSDAPVAAIAMTTSYDSTPVAVGRSVNASWQFVNAGMWAWHHPPWCAKHFHVGAATLVIGVGNRGTVAAAVPPPDLDAISASFEAWYGADLANVACQVATVS